MQKPYTLQLIGYGGTLLAYARDEKAARQKTPLRVVAVEPVDAKSEAGQRLIKQLTKAGRVIA